MTRSLVVDSSASTVTVRTRATGLLARLAHDLEIVGTLIEGRANDEGAAWTAELHVPVEAMKVAGVVKSDRVDPNALSSNDAKEISRRMREDAFRNAEVIKVVASGASHGRADVTVTIGTAIARSSTPIVVRDEGAGRVGVTGRCVLSLRALGAREIKGPLGAFQLKDEVTVLFSLILD